MMVINKTTAFPICSSINCSLCYGSSDRHLHWPAPSSASVIRWCVGLLCGSQVCDISVLSVPLQTRKEPMAVYRIVLRFWLCGQVFGKGETLTQIYTDFEIATMERYS